MSAEEELQGGIKNALERGIPVEKIVQSFINAGYPASSVHSAARAATEGAMTIAPPAPSVPSAAISSAPSAEPKMPMPSPAVPSSSSMPIQPLPVQQPSSKGAESDEEGTSKVKIILLVVVLIVLLGALAASLLFREQILGMLSG